LAMILGAVLVYGCMFATGNWIYGNYELATGLTIAVAVAGYLLSRVWKTLKKSVL
jgi:SSS family solute:Na+ symporter